MSRYSHEHHVRAHQEPILPLMETVFRSQNCRSFEIFPLPLDMEERNAFIDTFCQPDDDYSLYIVSSTDAQGWTMLWGDYNEQHQDELIAFLSEQLETTALYGHNNDQVDNWRWILFQQGEEVATYWYVGRDEDQWVNFPEYPTPPGAMDIYDAFKAQGRTYHHLNISSAVDIMSQGENALPIEQFRLVAIKDCP